ncbi:hypothetical protein [Aquipseudomonas campi]
MSLLNGFEYHFEFVLPDGQVLKEVFHNLIPQQGVDYWADVFLANQPAIGTWYMGIFEGNYLPTSATKASDIPSSIGECTAYSEASRPIWMGEYDGVGTLSNENVKSIFTLNADKTLYGAFVVSSSTKADGGGVMTSIGRFTTPKVLPAGTAFSCYAVIPLVPTDF